MLSLKIKFTSRRQELYQGEKWELAQAFVQVLFVCKSKAVFFVRKMNFILMVPMDLSKSHNCHSSHAPHGDNERMRWPVQTGWGEGKCIEKHLNLTESSWSTQTCRCVYIAESATPAAGTVDDGRVQVRLEGTLSFRSSAGLLALFVIYYSRVVCAPRTHIVIYCCRIACAPRIHLAVIYVCRTVCVSTGSMLLLFTAVG